MFRIDITTEWTVNQQGEQRLQRVIWRVEGPADLLTYIARRYFTSAEFVDGGLQWFAFTPPTDAEARRVARILRAAARTLEWARDVNLALSKAAR